MLYVAEPTQTGGGQKSRNPIISATDRCEKPRKHSAPLDLNNDVALACSFTISCKRQNGLAISISNFYTFIQDNPILKVISRTHQES